MQPDFNLGHSSTYLHYLRILDAASNSWRSFFCLNRGAAIEPLRYMPPGSDRTAALQAAKEVSRGAKYQLMSGIEVDVHPSFK